MNVSTAILVSFLSWEENAQNAEQELLALLDQLGVKYARMEHIQKLANLVKIVPLITFL